MIASLRRNPAVRLDLFRMIKVIGRMDIELVLTSILGCICWTNTWLLSGQQRYLKRMRACNDGSKFSDLVGKVIDLDDS